ncbi:transcription initiation factor TFIID subunit 2-like [Iris pallida]|uniref:Transcription initiation factor TFIID subunit 2-like n=1 Tax=Iris pallida TaxID=29817 RepID=A0AAX6GTD1_IRIPA|nr:transcription initiation factor TFIID subunit 2-like [Iris pallida]
MGSSTFLDGSVSADVGCKSCLCSPSCEESCVKREKHTFSDIDEKSVKTNPPEDLEISSSSEEEDSEHLIDLELGISFSDVLHVHDNLEPICVGNLGSDQDENSNHHKAQPLLLATGILDGSSKHTTALCSSVLQHSTIDSVEEFSCGTVNNDNISIAETPTPASADPLAKKPISALKGSRVKQGKYLTTKLGVKWAPEVYDPPVTSSSHTVKAQHRHHHHKTKKDYNTHKYTKGKSSRGSVNERKHAYRRSSSSSLMDPRISRSQAPGSSSSRQVRNSFGQSKMEPPELAVLRSPEKTIRGSSCCLESLTPIPLPVAKGPPNAQVEPQNLIALFCSAAM